VHAHARTRAPANELTKLTSQTEPRVQSEPAPLADAPSPCPRVHARPLPPVARATAPFESPGRFARVHVGSLTCSFASLRCRLLAEPASPFRERFLCAFLYGCEVLRWSSALEFTSCHSGWLSEPRRQTETRRMAAEHGVGRAPWRHTQFVAVRREVAMRQIAPSRGADVAAASRVLVQMWQADAADSEIPRP
jgi:hypothetical protein